MTAELIALGADNSKIARLIYDYLFGEPTENSWLCPDQELTILPELNTAYFGYQQKKTCRKYHSQNGDTEGLVN